MARSCCAGTVEAGELQHLEQMEEAQNVAAAAQQRGRTDLRISLTRPVLCSTDFRRHGRASSGRGLRHPNQDTRGLGLSLLDANSVVGVLKTKARSPRVTDSQWGLGRSERL